MATFDDKAKDWDKQKNNSDRSEAIKQVIEGILPKKEKLTGLEFGCGTGLLGMSLINNFSDFLFMDTSHGMLDKVNQKLEERGANQGRTLLGDVSTMPTNNRFDVIFSAMVLHHIPDYEEVMELLNKSLNSNGIICLADVEEEDGSFHESNHGVHHFGINPKKVEKKMGSLGLEILYSDTVITHEKIRNGEAKSFPIFLVCAKKG